MSKSLCCDFSYPFAEALGAGVTFLLALVADGYFRRTGTTEVWALSTSWEATIGINNQATTFNIDTGAEVTAITESGANQTSMDLIINH